MNEKKEQSKRMSTYSIVANCGQRFEFKVTATSPENACKRIQESLKRDARMKGLVKADGAKPCGYSWDPPSECAYIVSGGSLPDGTTGVFAFWNAEKIVHKKL